MVHCFLNPGEMRYGTDSTGSATTTEAVRRAIQNSEEILRALSKRYGINHPWTNRQVERMNTLPVRYKLHRFTPQIIAHAVWLHYHFPLSLRHVEEMLLERGITVSD